MKRKLVTLAATLSAFGADTVTAQSGVSISGTLDLSGKYVKNDGSPKRLSMAQDGINTSQLIFKGREDLGGGVSAGFDLNSTLSPNTGSAGLGGKLFNRRSTVSLSNRFGEIRLGRDWRPDWWNEVIFDAFGFLGIGETLNVVQRYAGFRADNSIGYFLPPGLGGVYGQLMAAAGEGGATADRPGRTLSGRLGFARGPVNVAIAIGNQRFDLPFPPNNIRAGGFQKTYTVGGSYDFGLVKVLGNFYHESLDRDEHENRGSVSAIVPIGLGEIHVGYDRSTLHTPVASSTIDQYKLGYVYNLSKRTALYGTVARLDNKDGTQASVISGAVGGASSQSAPPVPGGKSQGFEIGIRHFF